MEVPVVSPRPFTGVGTVTLPFSQCHPARPTRSILLHCELVAGAAHSSVNVDPTCSVNDPWVKQFKGDQYRGIRVWDRQVLEG